MNSTKIIMLAFIQYIIYFYCLVFSQKNYSEISANMDQAMNVYFKLCKQPIAINVHLMLVMAANYTSPYYIRQHRSK